MNRRDTFIGLVLLCLAGCGTDNSAPPKGDDLGVVPLDGGTTADAAGQAPTYTELYTKYFAAGNTPGHCANPGCHGDPGHFAWLCGADKDTCFKGMVSVPNGFINIAHPQNSLIISAKFSPLVWFNSSGNMPQDNPVPNPAAAADITAWINDGAKNN